MTTATAVSQDSVTNDQAGALSPAPETVRTDTGRTAASPLPTDRGGRRAMSFVTRTKTVVTTLPDGQTSVETSVISEGGDEEHEATISVTADGDVLGGGNSGLANVRRDARRSPGRPLAAPWKLARFPSLPVSFDAGARRLRS